MQFGDGEGSGRSQSGGEGGFFSTRGLTLDPSQSWEIAITRLRVNNPQEDRSALGVPLSNGDEPYLVIFGFRSVFGQAGTTRVWMNKFDDDNWATQMKSGEQRNIPAGMGTMRYEDVGRNEVVGLVVAAIESDRTPWAIMKDRIKEVREVVRATVSQTIETRGPDAAESTQFMGGFHQALRDAALGLEGNLTTGQALEDVVFSGVDTDEIIGTNSVIYMRRAPSGSIEYPHYRQQSLTDVLGQKQFTLGANALFFRNPSLDAEYEIEMLVRPLR